MGKNCPLKPIFGNLLHFTINIRCLWSILYLELLPGRMELRGAGYDCY